MEPIHYYNGEYLKKKEDIHISPDDVDFLRGHRSFDFFRLRMILFFGRPFESFRGFCVDLNIEMPMSKEEIKLIIHQLIERNDLPLSSIKIFNQRIKSRWF